MAVRDSVIAVVGNKPARLGDLKESVSAESPKKRQPSRNPLVLTPIQLVRLRGYDEA